MRAAAVKRKLWEAGEKMGTGKTDDQLGALVEMVSEMRVWMLNACVYVPVWHGLDDAAGWSEPGPPFGQSRADTNEGVDYISVAAVGLERQGLLATTPADYVSLACVAEPGPCEADVSEVGVSMDGVRCDGCWEELPFSCWCRSLRYCADCGGGGVARGLWGEPGKCKADVGGENFAETCGGEHGAAGEGCPC